MMRRNVGNLRTLGRSPAREPSSRSSKLAGAATTARTQGFIPALSRGEPSPELVRPVIRATGTGEDPRLRLKNACSIEPRFAAMFETGRTAPEQA